MALGIPFFDFDEVRFLGDDTSGAMVVVKFSFEDKLDNGEDISHVSRITVRINTRADSTIEDIQQAAFEKAVEQIHHIAELCEGKTARDLRREAHVERDARQAVFDAEIAKSLEEP